MEQYYIKKNGRYIPSGFSPASQMEGVFFKQFKKNGTRSTSILYWLGKPESEVDIPALCKIMQNDNRLADYLNKVQDENSQEFKDCGLDRPPKIYEISMQDLAVLVLRFLYKHREFNE